MIKFIKGRTKSIYFSLKGALHLIRTENSIQAQLFISICFIIAGFYFDISKTDEMLFDISLEFTDIDLDPFLKEFNYFEISSL